MTKSKGANKDTENQVSNVPQVAKDESKAEEVISPEVLEKMPSEARALVEKSMSMVMSGPFPHPIFSKMNAEHLSAFLNNAENESRRDHEDNVSKRRWYFAYLVVVLFFVLVISALFLWKEKAEYIVPIITALVGGVGGYGIGRAHKPNE